MPPRVPITHKAAARPVGRRLYTDYVCPSCTLWRLADRSPRNTKPLALALPLPQRSRTSNATNAVGAKSYPWAAAPLRSLLPRTYATLASRTAINPPSNVPAQNQPLYASLERLKDIASDYVNQSRLQLALRSLESERPTIRIGLLGLGSDGNAAAKQLARVLLADALSEEQAWEKKLMAGIQDGKTLLLTYGPEDDMPAYNPLVETVTVPSRVLQKHNLEILITTLNSASSVGTDARGIVESVLVPPLQTPVASTGRAGFVRYPVHKAVVVGDGVEGALDFGRLSNVLDSTALGRTGEKEGLIRVALNLPRNTSRDVRSQETEDIVKAVDIAQASEALDLFRRDVANGPLFNAKWKASNISSLTSWLTADSEPGSKLRSALEHHIKSTLDSTVAAINASEITAHKAQIARTISEDTRAELQEAITSWSVHAHTDLQFSLASAVASRSWRRTSWSRLLWRVDDVGVAAEDVLRSHWLLDAETSLAFLAGRVEQAGFFKSASGQSVYNPDYALHADDRRVDKAGNSIAGERAYLAPPSESATDAETKGLGDFFTNQIRKPTPAELLETDQVLERVKQGGGIDILHSRPWPLAIHVTRQKLLHTLVPTLQARAQTLLLSSLSTIGGTSALGVWIWVATKGVGIYEAGAVAALGLVWTLRRLQKKWEGERAFFEGEVQEEGRKTLADVEEVMRRIVRGNERANLRSEDVQGWRRAREAVGAVEEALIDREVE